MKIYELEQKSGLDRNHIRFYRKQGLLTLPQTNASVREYTEEDLVLLQKIQLLRRLDLSLDDIRALKDGTLPLQEAVEKRIYRTVQQHIQNSAIEQICREIEQDQATFATMDAPRYLDQYDALCQQPLVRDYRRSIPSNDSVTPARHPWRRLLARMLDLSFVSLISSAFLSLVFGLNIARLPLWVDIVLVYANWGLLMAAESLLLARFGTTPGKWLMGIRVEHADGGLLTVGEVTSRVGEILARGWGYALPIYQLYRCWKSYQDVMHEDGPVWDRNVTVTVREKLWPRATLLPLVWILSILLGIFSALLPILPRHRGEELTTKEFVSNYNRISTFLYGKSDQPLQTNGRFKERVDPPNTYSIVVGETAPIVLQFTEDDGVLRKISYQRRYLHPDYEYTFDSKGQGVISLTAMAYAWSDSGLLQALRSLEQLEAIATHQNGLLEQDFLGCCVSYSVTADGEGKNDIGFPGIYYNIEFSISR